MVVVLKYVGGRGISRAGLQALESRVATEATVVGVNAAAVQLTLLTVTTSNLDQCGSLWGSGGNTCS